MPATGGETTTDRLRAHAAQRPRAVALIDHDRAITFAQFDRTVARLTAGLRRLGLAPGSTAAVACDKLYLHWAVLLAFETLGVVTASFMPGEGPALTALLDHVDLVVADEAVPLAPGKRLHRLTPEWLDRLPAASDAGEAAASGAEAPVRITRSSGTTGGVKMMVRTRRNSEARIVQHAARMDLIGGTRLLILNRFVVESIYNRATACLRLGLPIIHDDIGRFFGAVVRHRPDITYLLPFVLPQILDRLPADFVKPAKLIVETGAAPLPPGLRQQVVDQLASNVVYTYSSNETSAISVIDASGIGSLLPGVEAEIVADDGTVLPPGSLGRIRVKSPAMLAGYLGNDEATAQIFRDGWFYTGDVGIIEAPRRLQVLGRHDEMLNLAGIKISPDLIETPLRADPAVTDAAATSLRSAAGFDEVGVAIVGEGTIDTAAIARTVGRLLPFYVGRVHVRIVKALPYTANGKLQRGRVRSELFGQD